MLPYSLTKKTVGQNPTGYIAYVNQDEKNDLNKIIDHMVEEGTGLTRPQALAYFEKLMQTVEYFIETKGGVSTPLFQIRTTIAGVFLNERDEFDPQRHSIRLRLTPGTRLNQLKKRLKLVKKRKRKQEPGPELFIDLVSETTNEQATPQGVATIRGSNLTFDPHDPRQGIFFIPENGSANFRVALYVTIRSTEINFSIPPLPPGRYTVAIHAVMRRHKSIRTGLLEKTVTVC